MALGAGVFDPYRLGYGNPQFVAVLLLFALFAWYLESALIASCIALAMFAWSVGWYESDNIWDYLLDPFVSFYALAASLIYGARKLQKWQRDSTG
jgi:ATP/ADP translocase